MKAQALVWLETIYFGKVSLRLEIFEDSELPILLLAGKHHTFLNNLEGRIAFSIALMCDIPAKVVRSSTDSNANY